MEAQIQGTQGPTPRLASNVEKVATSRKTVQTSKTGMCCMINEDTKHQNQVNQRKRQSREHSASSVRNANKAEDSGLATEAFTQLQSADLQMEDKLHKVIKDQQ